MMNSVNYHTVMRAYLTCALWAEFEPHLRPRATAQSKSKALDYIHRFIEAHTSLVNQALSSPGYSEEQFGHDLWLTSQGHGAGFWCRSELSEPTESNPSESIGETLGNLVGYGTKFPGQDHESYRGWFYLT